MNARQTGYIQTVFPQRGRIASLVLSICLALLSLSCSRQEKTAEIGVKEPPPTPPSGAAKLSGVLKSLETAGYAPVEAELEKDHWKIKAYSNGQLLQLKTDLMTGAVIPDPPPKLDKPLSEIVKGVEEQGYSPIVDIERGDSGTEGGATWDIEAYKGTSEVKVSVDAAGKIAAK
jgi:hypothetical protein